MRIIVVGTGVIGTLYGLALSQKHEVFHYVRPEKLSIYNNKVIQYDIIDERLPEGKQLVKGDYKYRCTTDLDADYIIVPVNSYQLIDCIKELEEKKRNGKYLLMTLNWDGVEKIDSVLNKDQYILGYAGGGGTFKEELLWANIGADILLGSVYKEQDALLQKFREIFEECRIIPKIPKDIMHTLWMHNVDSAALGVGLSKYNDMKEFIKDDKLVHICFDAMNEGYKTCEKRGVNLNDYGEVQMYKMPFDQLYPMFCNNWNTNPIMQRYSAHAVKAIDEMVANFKEIYKSAKDYNVDMPNMEYLSTLL